MRLALRRSAIAFLLGSLCAAPSLAAQVTNLTALVRDGQTFLTWTCPPGTGWIYRIYASGAPIASAADLYLARIVGAVRDSTWYDRRLSTVTGTPYSYRISPASAPLTTDEGLFVVTPTTDGLIYYAVTAQEGNLVPEDRTMRVNQNAIKRPVREYLRLPRPVYQRTLNVQGVNADIYTMWTSDTPTLYFPAMANVQGLAFDCAVVPPAVPGPRSSLMIRPHHKSGDFLDVVQGTGTPGEWVLALDDPLPNFDANTFWYGYHEGYDISSNFNTPPTDGEVHDYTLQRVLHTLKWVRASFGIDGTRVYAFGYSMGGIGSLMLAFNQPDLIAGVMSVIGKYDFSFVDDPNPSSYFNPGNWLREMSNRLWGEVSVNLPTNAGRPIYHLLNDGLLAGSLDPVAVPPILSFDGRWDTTVGWAEKIPFYAAMRAARQGGCFFWDNRNHSGTLPGAWLPLQDPRYLYRFRTDLSFPALSNCSADGDPGSGDPAVGDSLGTINGFVEWDTALVDTPGRWETRLYLRDLTQLWGTAVAPESVVVDVTPRRLQRFRIVEGSTYRFEVTRAGDGALIQSGLMTAGASDLITVAGVKVYRGGTVFRLEPQEVAGVRPASGAGRIQLRLSRNPARPGSTIELYWPASGEAQVELLDAAGRTVRTLFLGPVTPGFRRLAFPSGGFASGIYFIAARQGGERVTARAAIIR